MNHPPPSHQQPNRGLRSKVYSLWSSPHGLRSAVSSLGGFSLVELLVTTLIVIIVFAAWVRISNFQAIRTESLRRAAIEKATGYLDFMADGPSIVGAYSLAWDTNDSSYDLSGPSDPSDPSYRIPALFEESDPIGYVLRVVENWPLRANWPGDHGWSPNAKWAVIQLYDEHGVSTNAAGRPFSTMSVFMQ